MIGPTRHSLTQRLDRLERERHCWRGAAVLLAVTVVALVNLGAATPQPSDVRARSLTIPDRFGHSRIRSEMDDDEVTHIDMWGPSKRPVVYARDAGRHRAPSRRPDVTERRQPPSIVLFDEGGKLLWKGR